MIPQEKKEKKKNLATLVLLHNLKRWAQHGGKRVAQETRDTGLCTRGGLVDFELLILL